MELTKNIFFNTDKLVENTTVKISYTGKFFQDESKDVSIHYGFGFNWDNVNDVEMTKTDLGFQAEIELLEGDSFNFCFKNGDSKWDNNNGANYIFDLEAVKPELLLIDEEPSFLAVPNKLRKSYLWSKKIRLAIYKIITYLPKILSNNYKKKTTQANG